MNVSDSLAQKSFSECEIRINDIQLPPDDDSSSGYAWSQGGVVNDEVLENSAQPQSTNEHKEHGDVTLSLEPKTKTDIPHANSDSSKDSNSSVNVFQPPLPNKSNTFSISGNESESLASPYHTDKFGNKSPVLINKSSHATSSRDRKSSPFGSSFSYSLIRNQSPATIVTSTYDIPLPGQNDEGDSPPKPDFNQASPKSDSSVKVQNFDLTLNLNLKSSAVDMDIDLCEAAADLADSKISTPLIDDSDMCLDLDTNEKKKLDDSRYSPLQLESDDENQELTLIKPKVLGKEQAKKRLMAFSLSKQSTTSFVKKQNKLLVTQKSGKEKPPNPNKSVGVQEQFRATISEIEEEKKRMMLTIPNYFLMCPSNFPKNGDTATSNTVAEKSIRDEDVDFDPVTKSNLEKEDKDESKSKCQSRSPSRSRSSMQRRSSSSSRSRKHTRENDEKKDDTQLKKMESVHNWKSFAEAGLALDSDFRRLKFLSEEKHKQKDRKKNWSPDYKALSEYKPIFNYLTDYSSVMVPLKAKAQKPGPAASFKEKTIKYTRTKPVITWAENPNYATDFYMPKQMLLENCDKSISCILNDVIDQRSESFLEMEKPKQKYWYPQFNFLTESRNVEGSDVAEENREDRLNKRGNETKEYGGNPSEKPIKLEWKQKISGRTEKYSWDLEKSASGDEKGYAVIQHKNFPVLKSGGRRIPSGNEDILPEENKRNPVKELFVGDVKVQLDLELNSVKVKSKWDSDYDDDEKDSWNGIEKPLGEETSIPESRSLVAEYEKISVPVSDDGNCSKSSDINSGFVSNRSNNSVNHAQNSDFSADGPKGKLASEYEKFMKLVACEAGDPKSSESSYDKMKNSRNSVISMIMSDSKNSKNIDPSDWDLESDREEKLLMKKTGYTKEDTRDRFSMLLSGYDMKNKKKIKSPSKKKSGKVKNKDRLKKQGKNKRKKYKGKSSSESSSSSSSSSSTSISSDSDSESDSSDSEDEKRKRKKKKIKKHKKRYSSSSSSSSTSSSSSDSESESESESSESSGSNKKKKKKKKKNTVRKTVSNGSSGSNDETQSTMLKHLDLKKQQIIKKIEEIDSLDIANANKKKVDKAGKDENSGSETTVKVGKRKGSVKTVGSIDESKENEKETEEKAKSKIKSGNVSDRVDGDETIKGKKNKKKSKKQKWSSETSSDGGEKENRRTESAKSYKGKKKKKAEYFSSLDSDSDSDTSKAKKLRKKKKKKREGKQKLHAKNSQEMLDWNDHLLSDGPDFKAGNLENLPWLSNKIGWDDRHRNMGDDPEKEHKDLGDWENSSPEDSPKEKRSRESTWDEEVANSAVSRRSKEDNEKDQEDVIGDGLVHDERNKFLDEFHLESKHDVMLIESGLSDLGRKESLDSYSRENNASMQIFPPKTGKSCNLNTSNQLERNFPAIGVEVKKDKSKSKDERYSPGHTDSDISDENEKTHRRCEGESRPTRVKQEIHDPKSDSELSPKHNRVELNVVPPPYMSNILLPGDVKEEAREERSCVSLESSSPRSDFVAIPLALENEAGKNVYTASEKLIMPDFMNKKPVISVKLQQKFQSKVASVFQSDSEDEVETVKKSKIVSGENKASSKENLLIAVEDVKKRTSKDEKITEGTCYDKSGRSRERESRSPRSPDNYKENSKSYIFPRRGSRSPVSKPFDKDKRIRSREEEGVREERVSDRRSPIHIKSDSYSENGSKKDDEVTEEDAVRPIPVLTGLDIRMSCGIPWNRSHMLGSEDIGFSCDHLDLMDPSLDSYKLYGTQDGKPGESLPGICDERYGGKYDHNYGHDIEGTELDVLLENRMRRDKRKSRSRSSSPRKRRRSKSPDRRRSPRNRSPKRRSISPRRRGRSPYSPRRRGSPRSRRYKSSRSPERKRSRSPRKRRHSPSRRSRSISPRKHRDRINSPRRRSLSPEKDSYRDIGVRNLIHLTGLPHDENTDISSKYDSPMGFTRSLADSTISDSELNSAFYGREYQGEYGGQNYSEETLLTVNNLITLQNHDADKQTDSPKRLPLDQRIEIELGVPTVQSDQYQMPPQTYQQFPEHGNQYPNSYQCDESVPLSNSNGSQNFYSSQNSDFNGQYFNGQQPPPSFEQFQQYPHHSHPSGQNSVLQVGNIMEVVPTIQAPPPSALSHSKGHQIMQVGNVLQVVPSPKPTQNVPFGYGAPVSPEKNQKGSVALPKNNMPNPDAIINPLIKAIQMEREKRKKEKEKRRLEREARRKARQQKREAKLLSVNEKLKKSVQDEGLMLGQEVEEDELLEEVEHPSPPVPVEIVMDSSQNSLPPAGKGILITAGFIPKPASEKKEVKFADGICPGEGTSTSGGEDRASSPPKPKLPKEKRYKKKKTKLKKKVKVHIIRQVIQDDEDEDDLSPPPPPPGDPPPVFFARFPFGGKAQYPVYQTQTTTTTFTTVQFPSEPFQ